MRPPLVPPVYLLILLVLAVLTSQYMPLVSVGPTWRAVGSVALLGGLALVLWAAGLFTRQKTPIYPFSDATALVTGGIYRFTRNPMYLGMALILAGAALVAGGVSGLIFAPVFALIIEQKFILYEEMKLEKAFGEAYRDYCKKVRRWI